MWVPRNRTVIGFAKINGRVFICLSLLSCCVQLLPFKDYDIKAQLWYGDRLRLPRIHNSNTNMIGTHSNAVDVFLTFPLQIWYGYPPCPHKCYL